MMKRSVSCEAAAGLFDIVRECLKVSRGNLRGMYFKDDED